MVYKVHDTWNKVRLKYKFARYVSPLSMLKQLLLQSTENSGQLNKHVSPIIIGSILIYAHIYPV